MSLTVLRIFACVLSLVGVCTAQPLPRTVPDLSNFTASREYQASRLQVTQDKNGRYYIYNGNGGFMTKISGIPRLGIARVDRNGIVDTDWQMPSTKSDVKRVVQDTTTDDLFMLVTVAGNTYLSATSTDGDVVATSNPVAIRKTFGVSTRNELIRVSSGRFPGGDTLVSVEPAPNHRGILLGLFKDSSGTFRVSIFESTTDANGQVTTRYRCPKVETAINRVPANGSPVVPTNPANDPRDPCEVAFGVSNQVLPLSASPIVGKVAAGFELSVGGSVDSLEKVVALSNERFLILGDFALFENGKRYENVVLTTADGRIDERFRLPNGFSPTTVQRHQEDHLFFFGTRSDNTPSTIMYSLRDHSIVWSNNYSLVPSHAGEFLYGRVMGDPDLRRVNKNNGQLDPSWSLKDGRIPNSNAIVNRAWFDGHGGLWGTVTGLREGGLVEWFPCTTVPLRFELLEQGIGQPLAIPSTLQTPGSSDCPLFGFDDDFYYTQFGRMDLRTSSLDAVWVPPFYGRIVNGPFFTKNYVYWVTPDIGKVQRIAKAGDGTADADWSYPYDSLDLLLTPRASASDPDAFVVVAYQYDNSGKTRKPRFFFSNDTDTKKNIEVVEYYARPGDRYFMTGRDNEKALLDARTDLFERTGMTFTAIDSTYRHRPEEPVCRFYASPAKGASNTHFYGKGDDCALLRLLPELDFEAYDFAVKAPAGGACPADAPRTVTRLFNNRVATNNGNHRYVVSEATKNAMIAKGWVDEGVVFCATAATDARN